MQKEIKEAVMLINGVGTFMIFFGTTTAVTGKTWQDKAVGTVFSLGTLAGMILFNIYYKGI